VHGVFLDPTPLFCVGDECPVFVTTIPKTDDGVHMTVDYAEFISAAVHELFAEAGLLS
jgi:hypothetical protein